MSYLERVASEVDEGTRAAYLRRCAERGEQATPVGLINFANADKPLAPARAAELQRFMDGIARARLDHQINCVDKHGEYHYTPTPSVPGEGTCDVCGRGFVLEFAP